MAWQDLPMAKYASLMQLQKLRGCESLSRISVGQNAVTYNSRFAGNELQECVTEVTQRDIQTAVRNAKFFLQF